MFLFVQERMTEEAERAQQCLDQRTEQQIQLVLQEELIKNHMKTVVEVKKKSSKQH